MKKSIRNIDANGKRVLVRADFNVPIENKTVTDDTRIRAALPTIEYLLNEMAKVILCSHLGRPKGKVVEELRLDPVVNRLSVYLKMKITKVNDCVGPEVEAAVKELKEGEVLILENTRFHPEEEANDPGFAAKLASLADIYVNDAFGTAHRAHASTEGVARYLPAVCGLLMERELNTLSEVRERPEHPFILILSGAKISDKMGVIEHFIERTDALLIGGGMANTFLKARGIEVGESMVEDESLGKAKHILKDADKKLILPVDVVIAETFKNDAEHKTVSINEVPPKWHIMDIGPQTFNLFKEILGRAGTVLWNGPLGVSEMANFSKGTFAIAQALAELDAKAIIGGGDTAAAVNQAKVAEKMTHVSTGGGAFLRFMEGKELPGVAVIQDK